MSSRRECGGTWHAHLAFTQRSRADSKQGFAQLGSVAVARTCSSQWPPWLIASFFCSFLEPRTPKWRVEWKRRDCSVCPTSAESLLAVCGSSLHPLVSYHTVSYRHPEVLLLKLHCLSAGILESLGERCRDSEGMLLMVCRGEDSFTWAAKTHTCSEGLYHLCQPTPLSQVQTSSEPHLLCQTFIPEN